MSDSKSGLNLELNQHHVSSSPAHDPYLRLYQPLNLQVLLTGLHVQAHGLQRIHSACYLDTWSCHSLVERLHFHPFILKAKFQILSMTLRDLLVPAIIAHLPWPLGYALSKVPQSTISLKLHHCWLRAGHHYLLHARTNDLMTKEDTTQIQRNSS